METKEKVRVDLSNYKGFWELLNSADKENSVVALTALEGADFNKSLPYILMLFKAREADRQDWLDNAPELCKKLKTLGIDKETKLSSTKIIEIVTEKSDKEGLQFVLDEFTNNTLKKYCIEWGFTFMKDMTLKLIPKEDDTK